MLEDFDALLLIGDEALHLLRVEAYPHHFDLGAEWKSVTGLPMVYAVCAARRDFVDARPEAAAAVGDALLASRDACAAAPSITAAAAAQIYDFSQAYLMDYFDKLKFGFTPEYRAGSAGVLPARRRHRRAGSGARPRGVPHGRLLRTVVSCTSLVFRRPIPDDWERVMAVLPSWWDGRDLRALLPRIFFEHFRGTSLLVEHEDALVAFLVGFFCGDHQDEAYVHFAGVAPEWRRVGLASDLYRRFFVLARATAAA